MLVNGELDYELDSASLCMLEIPPPSLPGRDLEVERDDKLSLPGAGPAETNKQREPIAPIAPFAFAVLLLSSCTKCRGT